MSVLSRSQTMGVAALLLAASTLLSRFMGLIRDKVISWQFGAGSEADMYFAAFVVPDIINYLLAGGFMSITLIPLLSRRFAADEDDAWRFFSCVITWMGIAAVILTGLGVLSASPLSRLVAPGLNESGYERLALFMRIVLPAQIFFLTGSCLMSLLYLRRQFAVPALTPLIYNGCIILAGLFFPMAGLVQGMTGYCIGVTIGAALGTFIIPLRQVVLGGFRYSFCLWHPLFKKFIFLALPLMLGQTIAALDEQFLRVFGSLAGDGCVSLLNYAKRISQVPVALVGQAAAAASYPFLVNLLAKDDREGFMNVLSHALRSGTGIIVPVAMWMIFLSESTFTLIFYGGRMTAQDMLQAVPLLQILLAVTPCWMMYAILVRGYYAQADTLTPAVAGTICTLLFVPVYYYAGVPMGAAGIALVSALSMTCYLAVLMVIWWRREGGEAFRGLFSMAMRAGLCGLPGSAGGWYADHMIRTNLTGHSVLISLLGLGAAGMIFLVTFVPLSACLCPGVLDPLLRKIRGRFRRG